MNEYRILIDRTTAGTYELFLKSESKEKAQEEALAALYRFLSFDSDENIICDSIDTTLSIRKTEELCQNIK